VKSYRVRSYIPEKRQKGKRRWQGKAEEQQAVYETGGGCKATTARVTQTARRTGGTQLCTLLRNRRIAALPSARRENILKRQLAHVSAFNLSLVMRKLLGAGTPRELKNRAVQLVLRLFLLITLPESAPQRGRSQNDLGS